MKKIGNFATLPGLRLWALLGLRMPRRVVFYRAGVALSAPAGVALSAPAATATCFRTQLGSYDTRDGTIHRRLEGFLVRFLLSLTNDSSSEAGGKYVRIKISLCGVQI